MLADQNAHVEISSLNRGDNRFRLTASATECRAIAERIGEMGVETLSGDFTVTPYSGGVALSLHVTARVDRICVTSLEPITEDVDETYSIRLERDFDDSADDPEADFSREPLEGDTLDLGEILVQHLSLSLVSHPRKEGAKSLVEGYRDPVNLSPFAGLKGVVDGDA
ncbi:MAG: DUF177 domain-containing protein [Parvularculaceae bacterium]|nr:DUF177 domain-containing protein [Parvularculaceae bacterium]